MGKSGLITDKELENLFAASFKSLSFQRSYSAIIRDAVLTVVGLAVFLVGWFLDMLATWIIGIVVLSFFFMMAAFQFGILLYLAFKAKKAGKVVKGLVVGEVRQKMANRYSLEIQISEGHKPVSVLTQGPFWPVDIQILRGKQVRIIYLGAQRTCLLLP